MEVEPLNAFGTQLLKRWRKEHPEENVVFSTLSLAGAFALLFPGACGVTRTEMDAVFGFESKKVLQLLGRGGHPSFAEEQAVEWANRIYADRSIVFEKEYVHNVGAKFVKRADFAAHTAAALDKINRWVSKKTHGLIPTVLQELDADTVLVAVNALYFKGRWEHQFPPRHTRDDVFHGVRGSETVPFMQLNYAWLPYLECPDHKGVLFGLPYENSQLSMIIFLPDSRDGWKQAEKVMSAYCTEVLKQGLLREMEVDSLRMPKWELDFQFDNLPQMLMDLGLQSAFSPSDADFTNMTKDPRGIFVSDVVHKCKIIVNEEGTEAAAATAVHIVPLSIRQIINIKVDRPFLYFIVDRNSNTILFQGTQTSISGKPKIRKVEHSKLRLFASRCCCCKYQH